MMMLLAPGSATMLVEPMRADCGGFSLATSESLSGEFAMAPVWDWVVVDPD